MEQYIKKSALVAEIERKLQDLIVCKRDTSFIEHKVALSAKIDMCKEILSFLDTLEVKEVDLEKEISNYLDNHNLNIQDGGRIVFNNGDTPNFLCDFRDIAKHFFELGLKAKR